MFREEFRGETLKGPSQMSIWMEVDAHAHPS